MLQVTVRDRDIGVTCLVTGDNNSLCIGEVADPTVFQRVELIAFLPPESLAHFLPLIAETVNIGHMSARMQIFAKEVII